MSPKRHVIAVGSVLLVAFALRAYMTVSTAYVFDEDHDHIPTAERISVDPLDLPIRTGQHSALTAYFVKAGSLIAGRNPIGYRLFGVIAGMLTVIGVIRLAEEWAGPAAGLVAGSLLAVNEYHVSISALAVEKVYYLAFAVLFMVALTRLLAEDRTGYVFLAAIAAALAFLHKEIAALLIPIGGLTALLARKHRLLLRWQPYAALALFLLIISPDLLWQFSAQSSGASGDYRTHASRIAGIGFSYQPLVFFGREAIRGLFGALDQPFLDLAPEYPSMNSLMGVTLLIGSTLCLFRGSVWKDARGLVYISVFWLILLFFLFVETRVPMPGIDRVVWFWTDIALLPGVILTGYALTSSGKIMTRGLAILTVLACLIGTGSVFANRLGRADVAIGMCPEQITEPDKGWVSVQTVFQFCPICRNRPSEAILREVDVHRRGVETPVPATSVVRGAEPGRADREFEVLAELAPGESRRWYWLSYELPGRAEALEAGVGVMTREAFPPSFWACSDRTGP